MTFLHELFIHNLGFIPSTPLGLCRVIRLQLDRLGKDVQGPDRRFLCNVPQLYGMVYDVSLVYLKLQSLNVDKSYHPNQPELQISLAMYVSLYKSLSLP